MSFAVDVRRRLGERDIALTFESDARVVAIVGPSGAGKTSVLNMVAGLLRPDAGRIAVGGILLFDSSAGLDVPVPARRAGYVFQDRRLFPHLSVRANLIYGARSPERLAEIATLLDITLLLARSPRHLSGGEAQRVAIGRALLAEPAFLLLDEPLAHLDRDRAGRGHARHRTRPRRVGFAGALCDPPQRGGGAARGGAGDDGLTRLP